MELSRPVQRHLVQNCFMNPFKPLMHFHRIYSKVYSPEVLERLLLHLTFAR
jgi:hypothetical protein